MCSAKYDPDEAKQTFTRVTVGTTGKIRVTGQRLGSGKSCSIYKVDLIESAE